MTIRTEPMTVNVGPQHPSTHGVFRVRITFDGEDIVEVEPVLGYLHRGTEKLAEERNYVQVVTLTDRLDYTSSMINNQAYCLAVEQLLGIEPPPRGKYLRTLTAELQRIASHLIAVGFLCAGTRRLRHAVDVHLPQPGAHPGPVRDAVRRANYRELHEAGRSVFRRAAGFLAGPEPVSGRL